MLGTPHSNKSRIALSAVRGFAHPRGSDETVGAAFLHKQVSNTRFEIWDTASQERYHSLAPMYYRGAAIALVFFAALCEHECTRAKQWVQELRRYSPSMAIILVATHEGDRSPTQASVECQH